MNISNGDLTALGSPHVVTTSMQGVIIEFLQNHQNIHSEVQGRLAYV